jgi:cytidylate kinase
MKRTAMTTRLPNASLNAYLSASVERELERERHERRLHDEQRAGLAVDEQFRIKDARELAGAVSLKRPPAR